VSAATQKKQALEFLIHFLGDITQPLHTEAEEVGGNDIDVLWNESQRTCITSGTQKW